MIRWKEMPPPGKVVVPGTPAAEIIPVQGVYELDGDTLRLCIGPVAHPPTELTDRNQQMLTLKRKKS